MAHDLRLPQMERTMELVVGTRIREARTSRNLSLNEVASRAHISVATLSRIERDKQGVDLGLFLNLCRILKAVPHELLGPDGDDRVDPIAVQIARLKHDERVQLWRDLTVARKNDRRQVLRSNIRRLGEEVEELLAQLEYVQAEIQSVHTQVKKKA
jgi:transcriptional regulator with XRE-family HTH domain